MSHAHRIGPCVNSAAAHIGGSKAFGNPPEVLVGLAVSADSDDTNSRLRASLSNLTLG